MKKYSYHKDHTVPTNKDEIFVFGSNLAAVHGAGAARLAAQCYGATPSIGEGHSGKSYAIPTKDKNIETLPLSSIKISVKRFLAEAKLTKSKYFVTRIGCVLAGYSDSQIAPMFKTAPATCNFPEEWEQYLEPKL